MLAELYNEAKDSGENELEIIFVSSDHDQSSFDGYFGSMPWIAIPFEEDHIRSGLGAAYSVQGIPTLIVLDRHGKVLDSDGRSTVASVRDAGGCLRKWTR